MNRQFLLAARPRGWVKEGDFKYQEDAVPTCAEGQILVRTKYISLDPSMRGQMENRADYAAPLEVGDVMRANGVAEVIESKHADFTIGDLVLGSFGMQDYMSLNPQMLKVRKFAAGEDPLAAISVYGGTGMTAYFGLLDLGEPSEGQVVVVSGAAGATGMIASQIAKIKGCTVIGLAGSDAKCEFLRELGLDGTINYKTENIGDKLTELCPSGIDIYFDNVGGEILDLCLARLAMNARVVICGGISRYNLEGPIPGPKNYFNLVYRRARMEGFIVVDYADRFKEATEQLSLWVNDGRIRYKTHVVDGFENLPRALIGMFNGENLGKTVVACDA
jgi:hypothetical protein